MIFKEGWDIRRIGAHFIIFTIYLICLFIAYWAFEFTIKNQTYQSIIFWVIIIPCLLMGWYWGELRTYLGKYKKIGWLFALSLLVLTYLAKTGNFSLINNSIYLISFSPFTAMNRFYFLEYTERKTRKTIFSK